MWRFLGRSGRALALAVLFLSPVALSDRRDTKAADLYDEARKLIQKGKHADGARLIGEALKRGATEPCELQGDSRFGVRQYDPYYWLGVAQMEMGLDEQALANFTKSETIVPDGESRPVISKWKSEYQDLQRRKAILLARLAPPTPAPMPPTATPEPILAPPTPKPAVVLAATPTAIRILLPTAVPTPTVPGQTPFESALRSLRSEYATLLADPAVGPAARPLLSRRLTALDSALAAKASRSEADWKRLADVEREAFTKDAVPAISRAALVAGLDALGKRRWEESVRLSELARRLDPKAHQPDVLACAALGSRYLLEQRKDPTLIQAARAHLRAWREKTGSKEMPVFLSPALRDALR